MAHTRAGRSRPSGSFELVAWLFMRISGIVMILLVLAHLAIMHVFNSVHNIDYQFVAERYARPEWRVFDLLMITLALFHGLNGARTVISDYVHARGWRIFAVSALYLTAFVFFIIGSYTILTFQPAIS